MDTIFNKEVIQDIMQNAERDITNQKSILEKLRKDILRELKEATRLVTKESKKTLKAQSEETGIGYNHLLQSSLQEPSGCNFQLQWLPLVTISSSNYHLLDTIEFMVGRIGITIPPPGGACTSDICRLTMQSMKEFGELVDEVDRSIEDNEIIPSERRRIQKEGYEAIQAILTLMEACK